MRLFQLQIISGQSMFNKSLDNQFTFASLQPQRGQILDRYGTVIANNTPIFHLDITVTSKKSARAAIAQLHQKVPFEQKVVDAIHKRIDRAARSTHVRVLSNLSQTQLNELYLGGYHLEPFSITPEFTRSYPHGHACSALTGYVLAQKIAKDSKSNNPNILATYSGADGVEKTYDKVLSGQFGVAQLQRDAQGNILQSISDIPAQNGADIFLTIDLRLQNIIKDKMHGKRGAVVVSNPSTGEVLGLFSAPSYDPNVFLDATQQQTLSQYLTSSDKPLFNRVLAGQFPPASTVKPFLALFALDAHIIDTEFSIYDPGYFRYKDTANIYRNWNRGGHGQVNAHKAIVVSNDTFFYHLALKIGIDRMRSVYDQYGFGRSTGIDLPGEKTGIVPDRSWKKQKGLPWLIGDTIITGIGQGSLLVTPAQMAHATNLLATQGQAPNLHVVQSIRNPGAAQLQLVEQRKQAHGLTFVNWEFVTSAMQKVVKFGTGRRFGHHNLPFAAKTGTAQLVKNSGKEYKIKSLSDHSWFIGFLIKDPSEFAITVLVENENDAIVIAREIVDSYFDLPEMSQ